jgi:biopolymer transport protein ExbD
MRSSYAKPYINVTPLIDVLLVMLIIFMAVAPLKSARFLAQVPSEPDQSIPINPAPLALVVTIKSDRSLMLNHEIDLGSVDNTSKLIARLTEVFAQRLANRAFRYELRDRVDLPDDARIEKTVFIKAPGGIPYGEVVRVLDGIKGAGATPVGLQIDGLD